VSDFIAQLLANPERNAFLRDFSSLAPIVSFFGRINSLVTTVLKITVPGVPDFYQGTELPTFTLVDPDNRALVDFDSAATQLAALSQFDNDVSALLEDASGARGKLYVTAKLLQLRAAKARLFASGGYVPLQVEGDRKDHVFAFARVCDGAACIVIVPRWSAKLMQGAINLPLGAEVWGDTKVMLGAAGKASFLDVFSALELRSEGEGEGRSLRVAEVFSKFPVAVLQSTA